MKRAVANIEEEFRHVLNLNKQREVNFKFNMSCLTMLHIILDLARSHFYIKLKFHLEGIIIS